MSLALADEFFTTEPPRKPLSLTLFKNSSMLLHFPIIIHSFFLLRSLLGYGPLGVKTWPLTVTHVSYLGLPGTLLPGNGVCFALRSCRQNPDSLLRLSGVCSMLSKVTMTSRFSDVPFFFSLCAEGYCSLYSEQPLGGWQDWAERKHG